MEKKERKMPGIKEWLLILAAGAILLIFSVPDFQKKKNEVKNTSVSNQSVQEQEESYQEKLERKLKSFILGINGVTDASVMITLKCSGEEVILKETENSSDQTIEEDSEGGKRNQSLQKNDETVILSEGIPYVTKEVMPKVEGVVVLITGGSNETVLSVSYAVQALFDVPAHKVRVIKN